MVLSTGYIIIFLLLLLNDVQADQSELCKNSRDTGGDCNAVQCQVRNTKTAPIGGQCMCVCCESLIPQCVEYNYTSVRGVECRCAKKVLDGQVPPSDVTDEDNTDPPYKDLLKASPSKDPFPEHAIVPQSSDCVSTSWLEENGFSHAILRKTGLAKVLCLPDLPCATPGHMLRKYVRNRYHLLTYAQVCAENNLCVESKTYVSQISHIQDWSFVKSGDLSLTSVSVDPNSKSMLSISRLIAHLADHMNAKGFGRISNIIVLSRFRIPRFIHMHLVGSIS